MRRFEKNHLWTYILALGLVVACSMSAPRTARSSDVGGVLGSGDGTGGGVPAGAGDPDSPTGPGKTTVRRGAMTIAPVAGMRAAGDGSVSSSAWMVRLHVLVQGLRSYVFYF
jgi:hypothetical protein